MLSNFSKYLELNSFNVDGKTFRKGKHSKAKTKRSQNILSYISQTFMKEDLYVESFLVFNHTRNLEVLYVIYKNIWPVAKFGSYSMVHLRKCYNNL